MKGNREKECLRKQIEILSEASKEGMLDDGLSNYSNAMVKINRELRKSSSGICLCVMIFNLIISLFILIQKLRRG